MALQDDWQTRNWRVGLLYPLSCLFGLIVWTRRLCYDIGLLRQVQLPVPVIIVGNVTVGGTGKTPLTIYLANALRGLGYHPGIISRGYKGASKTWPRSVHKDSDPYEVGDEPVLLAQRTGCPVVVGPDRVAAAKQLLAEYPCDILFSDDGMQHYRLARTLEVAVLDAKRRLGNRLLLPAGPLREPPSRLNTVDFQVYNGIPESPETEHYFTLAAQEAVNLRTEEKRPLTDFSGCAVHAVAGIGHPPRFFDLLRRYGVMPHEHAFTDHHHYREEDLAFSHELPVLMTEKDAVKCRDLVDGNAWYVPVEVELHSHFVDKLLARLSVLGNK